MPKTDEKNNSLRTSAIEFWFEFGSNYSYLSVMRIQELAAKNKLHIIWKPFLLGPIFKSLGWESSPFVAQKQRGDYAWKDMARQCQKYQIPWQKPSQFPRSAIIPMRVAIYARDKHWMNDFCQKIMLLNFSKDRDIDSVETVTETLNQLGLASEEIIKASHSEPHKPLLRQFTQEAQQRGIFGAPTFFVNHEMFWGNDRLDDAIKLASNKNN